MPFACIVVVAKSNQEKKSDEIKHLKKQLNSFYGFLSYGLFLIVNTRIKGISPIPTTIYPPITYNKT
jgi:hypothetical protein